MSKWGNLLRPCFPPAWVGESVLEGLNSNRGDSHATPPYASAHLTWSPDGRALKVKSSEVIRLSVLHCWCANVAYRREKLKVGSGPTCMTTTLSVPMPEGPRHRLDEFLSGEPLTSPKKSWLGRDCRQLSVKNTQFGKNARLWYRPVKKSFNGLWQTLF